MTSPSPTTPTLDPSALAVHTSCFPVTLFAFPHPLFTLAAAVFYGNSFSRVNVSGPGYHLPTKERTRTSLMHPYHFDILEDALAVVQVSKQVST